MHTCIRVFTMACVYFCHKHAHWLFIGILCIASDKSARPEAEMATFYRNEKRIRFGVIFSGT